MPKKMTTKKMTAKEIKDYERSRQIYCAKSSGQEVSFPLEDTKSEMILSFNSKIKKLLMPDKVIYSDAEHQNQEATRETLREKELEEKRREDLVIRQKEKERLEKEKEDAGSEGFADSSFWTHNIPKASEQVMTEKKMMAKKNDELSRQQYHVMSCCREVSLSSDNNDKSEDTVQFHTTVKDILTPCKSNQADKETDVLEEKKLKKRFVGNLSCNTKEEELVRYFDQYEKVLNCSIARNPVTNESRCYGYIEFQHSVPVSKVLGTVHAIRDNIITVHAEEKGEPEPEEFCKIFIRNLHPSIILTDLLLYFGKYGNVEGCKITRSKGYATVQFSKCYMMYKALDTPSHAIKDKSFTVEKFVEPECPEHHRKIKVGHLNSCTTEDTLVNYFKQYGEILSCGVIKKSNTSELMCFAFLIFEKLSSIRKIPLTKTHFIDNKCVTIELPKKINLFNEENRKVYIEDVPFYVKIGTLYEYFEMFGPVISCVLKKNIYSGEPEGCGYIIFQHSKDAASCASSHKHLIDSEGYGTHEIISYRRKQNVPEHLRTIKVLHLSDCTTDYTLNNYFNNYGKVASCRIIKENNGSELIYSAHLIFDKASTIKKIPLTTTHKIDDKFVTIVLPKKPNFETSNKNYAMNRNALQKKEDLSLNQQMQWNQKSTKTTPRVRNLSLNQQMQWNQESNERSTPRVRNSSLNQQTQWNTIQHPLSEEYWDKDFFE